MSTLRWLALCFALPSITACGKDGAADASANLQHVARTSGGAVALSRDERIAVVTNRTAGVVTILSLNPGSDVSRLVTNSKEVPTGEGSEPWAAIIGADDDTAYVILRKSREVVRISSLRDEPTLDPKRVSVGAEPMSLALTPTGGMLFVANWAEGTLSLIITREFGATPQLIDLNRALVARDVLGEIAARPGLAHPRALAITDDGDADDFDETLYATEFFSQPLTVTPDTDFSNPDRSRQGFVYTVDLHTGNPGTTIPIAPVVATGFADAQGMTSCFPNQLSAATLDNGRLYVTSMCTSPRGPLGSKKDVPTPENFKTLFHPAVFVIDTVANEELPGEGRLLTRVLSDLYAADGDESSARMPLTPNDIAFRESHGGKHSAYVSALGADAIFRLDYDAAGAMLGVGSPGARYIDAKPVHGLLSGLSVSRRSSPAFALGLNDGTQQVSVVALDTETVTVEHLATTTPYAQAALASSENIGHRFFATGRDLWSFRGQAWSSCEGCHPGGLSDGVTWFFQRGPRRTLSTANTYDEAPDPATRGQRLLLWGANVDEVHDVEAITRGVSGGIGGVLWTYTDEDDATSECRLLYDSTLPADAKIEPCLKAKATTTLNNGLNGSLGNVVRGTACRSADSTCDGTNARDWNHIDDFIRSLRVPKAPVAYSDEAQASIAAGRALFSKGRCTGCHAGPSWTVSTRFYTPGADANGALPYMDPSSPFPSGFLREQTYQVPAPLANLNPVASRSLRVDCAVGMKCATFRDDALSGSNYQPATQGDDQIRCAIRDVGTFPVLLPSPANNFRGVAAGNAPPVFETRQDMVTKAQGELGFSVPSLFGLAVGAPYFHAGNARTLEEVFDSEAFQRHHAALVPDFLSTPLTRVDEVASLVAFLLSIDETTELEPLLGPEYDFCGLPR